MTQPSDVTARYLAAFRAFAGNGAAGAPPWLKEVREGAIARFAELGFPTMKQEEWRFTSVAPIAETAFERPREAVALTATTVGALGLLTEGPRAVFVDGRYAPALSTLAGLAPGVLVGGLGGALQPGAAGELVRRHLTRYARWQQSPFAALNTAFLADGALVYVPPGVVLEAPLELVFLSSGGGTNGPTVSHPRSLVILERDARAAVVETYAGVTAGGYWTNAVTEIVVGDGARAELYRVQREGAGAYHIGTTHSHQGRDAVLGLHVVTLGGRLARHDITTVLGGAGAELILNGLYLLDGAQHADHHTVIDHAQPHCTSHEFFNGVIDDRAHGVFNGRIVVEPGAQRTDSKQTNNNLLLSTEARADSQPQLEIYADDVKCTHGSTVGPIDPQQLYYLRSRGLSPETARGLLTYGFGAEILDRMTRPAVRTGLERLVRERLA
jgi:Fe-S cluster assembly protein SufD